MLKRQRGYSTIEWAIIVAVGFVIITCAVKMIPVYVEHTYVDNALKTLVSSNANLEDMEKSEIQAQLSKYMSINSVKPLQAKSMKVKRYDGRLFVNAVYDVSVPLGANISVVMSFKSQLDTQNPDLCCDFIVDDWDEKN